MLDPLRIATAVLEIGMARYGRAESRTTAASIALVAVGVLCAAGAGGFGVAALTIYLIPIIGAAGATLVVAGALVTLSCVALASSHYLSHRSRNDTHRAQAPPDLAALAGGAEDFIRGNKALMLSAAVVAGLLVGDERSKSTED